MGEEQKAIKITHPGFLAYFPKSIQDLVKKLKDPTITYETLYTYFNNTVQFGGDLAEFWAVTDGAKVYGYAHFYVKALPHRGVVCCDYIYCCKNRKNATQLLVDEYIEFGKRNRSYLYEGTALGETTFRVFRNRALKAGYDIKQTGKITFLGSKKE